MPLSSILAESVSLSGSALLIGLLLLVTVAAIVIGVFAAGCVAASRAGRGSQDALVLWLVIAGVELLPVLTLSIVALTGIGAVAIQAALYRRGRSSRPPASRSTPAGDAPQ